MRKFLRYSATKLMGPIPKLKMAEDIYNKGMRTGKFHSWKYLSLMVLVYMYFAFQSVRHPELPWTGPAERIARILIPLLLITSQINIVLMQYRRYQYRKKQSAKEHNANSSSDDADSK